MLSDPMPADPEPLLALGWGADLGAAYERYRAPDQLPGRVLRVDRGRAVVLTAAGSLDALPEVEVCTGDWVVVRRTPTGPSFVSAVLPRRTLLRRAAAGGESTEQALAANADAIALVEGLVPTPSLSRVERLLVLLWETGATPLIVLTKADLVPDAAATAASIAASAAGAEVLVVSSATGGGVEALAPHVAHGRTLALLGRSGAGKSTLTNRLVGAPKLATGAIREDGRGRHTTVRRELLQVPGGGAVIDTPGLRAAGLHAGANGVAEVFADVAALAEQCRFADCAHAGEPGCAVAAAVAGGTLAPRRLESYRKLEREAAWIASRTDARLRAERTKVWKHASKEHRHKGQRQRGGRP